jgi:hypothetical protein
LSVVFVLAASQDSRAVDPAKRRQQPQTETEDAGERRLDDSQRPAEDRRMQIVRERDQGVPERHADLNQQGSPAFRPPRPYSQNWMLGVRCWYLDTGARVTHVFPNTPAWRVGLEPRDVIVSIDGYQIGYVQHRFYEISAELNARAGRTGRVRLLVQNWRNNQLVNLDVQLARIGSGFPRERFGLPEGSRIDQADEDQRERAGVVPEPKARIRRDLESP